MPRERSGPSTDQYIGTGLSPPRPRRFPPIRVGEGSRSRISASARAAWAPAHRHFPTFSENFPPVLRADPRAALSHHHLLRAPHGPVLAHIKAVYRVKRLESELTMITAQTKALEALAYCMKPVQTTGDTKLDHFHARERNRQRLAAIQTILHIRAVQREKRLRQTMRPKAKAKAERSEPNRASDGSQVTKKEIPSMPARSKGAMVGAEGAGHVDNGSTIATPVPSPQRGRRWSCADSAQDRMRGRPEPSDHHTSNGATGGLPASAGPHQPEPRADNATPTNLTEPTTPTAPHWRASRQWHPKPPKPFPAPSRTSSAARLIALAGSTTGLTSTARAKYPPKPHPA